MADRRQPAPALRSIIRSTRRRGHHKGNDTAPPVPERVEVFLPRPVRMTQPQWLRYASCEPALRMRSRHAAPWHLPDAASRITLEPGLPSSTGVARLPRYYRPLRRPAGPSRSSGWRVPRLRQDFPCCSGPPLPCVPPPLPRRNRPVHASFASRSMAPPPRENGGSASALAVSGPARRSLALRPAWSLNRPRRPFSRSGSDDDASIMRSDCYRLERPLLGGIRTRWRTLCSWQP